MNDLMEACFDIGILTGVDSAELQVIEFQIFNLADPIKKSLFVANSSLLKVQYVMPGFYLDIRSKTQGKKTKISAQKTQNSRIIRPIFF